MGRGKVKYSIVNNKQKLIDGYIKSQTGLITTTVVFGAIMIGFIFYIDRTIKILPTVF
jgi:hypothetical protein